MKQILLFNYEDMTQVFSKFGKILRLEVLEGREVVLVFMEKFKDAFNALKFMHLRKLQVEDQVDNLKCNFLKEKELHLIPGPELLEMEENNVTDSEEVTETESIRKESGTSNQSFTIRDTTEDVSAKVNQNITYKSKTKSKGREIKNENGAKIITNLPNIDLMRNQESLLNLGGNHGNILNMQNPVSQMQLNTNSQIFNNENNDYSISKMNQNMHHHQNM